MNDTRQVVQPQHARDGQFPYHASLRDRKTSAHFCSGAILHKFWVVTAAHCMSKRNLTNFEVAVGSTDIYDGTYHGIRAIYKHPHYIKHLRLHDICMLQTKYAFHLSDKIYPVQVPRTNWDKPEGGDVTDWSLYSDHGPISFKLQYVYLKTITLQKCKSLFPRPVHETSLCVAGKHDWGICMSNGGSPLVAKKKLIGLVTWEGICKFGLPDVFTKVAEYRQWIFKFLQQPFET